MKSKRKDRMSKESKTGTNGMPILISAENDAWLKEIAEQMNLSKTKAANLLLSQLKERGVKVETKVEMSFAS